VSENVAAVEIESFLASHLSVKPAQVVGLPTSGWWRFPRCSSELAPGSELTEAELVAYCKDQIAGFKVPRDIRFRDRVADVRYQDPEVPPPCRAPGRARAGRPLSRTPLRRSDGWPRRSTSPSMKSSAASALCIGSPAAVLGGRRRRHSRRAAAFDPRLRADRAGQAGRRRLPDNGDPAQQPDGVARKRPGPPGRTRGSTAGPQ